MTDAALTHPAETNSNFAVLLTQVKLTEVKLAEMKLAEMKLTEVKSAAAAVLRAAKRD